MKKMTVRALLLLLCLAMIGSSLLLLASCDEDEEGPSTDTGDVTLEGEDAPELPSKKYGGDFILLGQGVTSHCIEDASSGDIVDYAMYIRNTSVEDTYGITIKPVELFYAKVPDQVSMLIKAGDEKSVDVVVNHIVYSSNIVLAGNAADWCQVPYIDFTAPYWPRTNVDDLTINGQNHLAIGDFSLSTVSGTPCMYFNKELVKTYSMGDIYATVNAGEWTYSEMLRLVTGVYKDLNEDQTKDNQDLYGLITGSFTSNTAWMWGFDNPIFSKNENTGELECTFFSGKIERISTNLVKLFYRTEGVRYDDGREIQEDFVNGRGVFCTGNLNTMTKELRSMEGWGVIPYPKYNKNQPEYKAIISGGCHALIVPSITTNEEKLERIGVIMTALEYKSSKDVMPAFYEKALKAKYADAPTEAKMIDIISASRIVDFGYIFMGFEGPSFTLQGMLSAHNDDVASSWNHNKSKYSKKIEKAYAAYGLTFAGLE